MKSYLDENAAIFKTTEQVEGVRVGKIVNTDESGRFWVDFPGNSQGPMVARITSSVKLRDLHKSGARQDVLLVFENNDPKLPIIIDAMHSLIDKISESSTIVLEAKKPEDVIVDGKKIVFDAKEEIVLKCGKASITLTRAGKVLIRGVYLLSRSSGVNRLKGGSVQIN